MGRGRRDVAVDEASRWVFNRAAAVYDARPAYPVALIDALSELAGRPRARIVDLGAGIGHLALPLAARGLDVIAVEPAISMLDRLRDAASASALGLGAVHAAAERLPIEASSVDLAVIADAIHFMDIELTGAEVRRVLTPAGSLAVVTCDFAETPFMRAVLAAIYAISDRRPREMRPAIAQLAALAKVRPEDARVFQDATPVELPQLEQILRSLSFVGPAMNAELFEALLERVRAISTPRVWSRRFTLYVGRRHRRRS
jgi:ubiquinone/menaquinone biosynthesis C-methylase UbiE